MIDSGDPTFIKGLPWDKSKFDISSDNVKIYTKNRNLYGSSLKKDSITTKKYYKINSLNIGGYEMNNVIVDGGVCIVGLSFLKNFDITIDWINHVFYFKENGTNNFPINIFTFGFKIVNHKGKLKIGELCNESIASRLGVKLGDEVLSLNGIEARYIDKKTIEAINNNLPIDDEFTFVIEGIEKEVKLRKEKLFRENYQ